VGDLKNDCSINQTTLLFYPSSFKWSDAMFIVLRVVLCCLLFLNACYAQDVAQNRQDGTPPQASTPPWATPLGLMQHTADQIETPADKVRALATVATTLQNGGRDDMAQTPLPQIQKMLGQSQKAKAIDAPRRASAWLSTSS
jgi:hypothetical protein